MKWKMYDYAKEKEKKSYLKPTIKCNIKLNIFIKNK